MLYYSPLLTAVVAGSLPCYVVLSIFVTPIIRTRLRERFDRGAENQAFLVEMITGIETVKAMAVEPAMQRRWDDQLAEYVRASFRATLLSNTARQIASWLNKITTGPGVDRGDAGDAGTAHHWAAHRLQHAGRAGE